VATRNDRDREKQREWYRANKERHRAKGRAWAEENRERLKEYHAAYYEANREKWTAYAVENADRRRENARRRRAEEPELRRRHVRAYQARKLKVRVEDVNPLVVLERDDGICGICGADVDPQAFEVDHVIPISRGGSHSYDNVQAAHGSCNRRKNARMPDEYEVA
jgi:5-methylcytosine-specific restriction endonuclease McrA